MQVKLTRRWAVHRAGSSVEVSDSQGAWLVQHGYAESTGELKAPEVKAAAEGSHGADPVAGGDATRRRPRITRPERDANRNYAQRDEKSSPTYRAGFDSDAAQRQGEVGRVATTDPRAGKASAVEGSVAAAQEATREDTTVSDEKPARRTHRRAGNDES